MSVILVIALVLFVGWSLAHSGRRSLNDRLGARPRPVMGAVALLLLGVFLMSWLTVGTSRGPRRTIVEVQKARPMDSEVVREMQEHLAIEQGVTMDQVKRAWTTAREHANAARSKVAKMIDAAATKTPEEATPEASPPSEADAPLVAEAEAEDSHVDAPSAPRPKWVGEPAGLVGGVYSKNIKVGPFTTRAECDQALPQELTSAVDQYIETYLGAGASRLVTIAPAEIHDNIVKDLYEETYDASFAPMKYLHVHLAFDQRVQKSLQRRYHAALSESRMKEVALGAGGVLLLLGTMFSYLKLDTATRGYYTGRLRVAAALVIVTAGVAAFRMVQFM